MDNCGQLLAIWYAYDITMKETLVGFVPIGGFFFLGLIFKFIFHRLLVFICLKLILIFYSQKNDSYPFLQNVKYQPWKELKGTY